MDNNGNIAINNELLVIIAAAIASVNTRPGYRLVVRSMRQVPQSTPVWNIAGRVERLGRKLNA